MYAVNLEMDNSPKLVLFNIVSGQIVSNALWKFLDLLCKDYSWKLRQEK